MIVRKIKINTFEILLFIYLAAYFAHNTSGIEEYIEKASFLLYAGYTALLLPMVFKRLKKSTYLLWFCLFLTYGFLSAIWAISPSMVFSTVTVYAQILAVIIGITHYVKQEDDIYQLMHIFMAAVLYSLVILFIKEPNVFNWFPSGELNANGWHRNSFSVLLYLGCMMGIYCWRTHQKKKYLLYSIIFAISIIPCTSRKTILMIIVAVGVFLILNSKNPMIMLRNIFVAILLALAAIYAIFNVPSLYNIIGYRFSEVLNYFTGTGYVDFSTRERAYLIEFAKTLFESSPVFGVGLDNFSYALGQVYSTALYSHNTYWELLSTLGVVGFSIYYGWLVYLLWKCAKRYFKHRNNLTTWTLTMLIVELIFDYICISYNTVFTHFLYMIIYMSFRTRKIDNERNYYLR